MSLGLGRGRGWLNLKNQPLKSPGEADGPASPSIANNMGSPNYNVQESSSFSDISDDYSNIINRIKQLNVNDDGIKFNQKMKYIADGWKEDCASKDEVQNSFNALHHACLNDHELAAKTVQLITAQNWPSIHKMELRILLIMKLQECFENHVTLYSTNPTHFRGHMTLMGDFYNARRRSTQFQFLIPPLLTYFHLLLDSSNTKDIKLLTMQLYKNGSALKQAAPEKVAELLDKVRLKLCTDTRCSKESKLWLLLVLEVATNKFSLLPSDTQRFYQDQLGEQVTACFQSSCDILTVQTMHSNQALDNYLSNVNVLQVSTEPPNDTSVANSSEFNSTQSFHNDSKKTRSASPPKNAKSGRPILGVGARLQRKAIQNNDSGIDGSELEKSQMEAIWNVKQNQDNNGEKLKFKNHAGPDNWRERDTNSRKGNDQGKTRKEPEKSKTPPKNRKGWEHDDRFENNYN